MVHPILGLHHVTATVDDAQRDLDVCLDLLGMRFVKKTVNFDNHDVYHFYYGTERGVPGTIWTTFPYKGRGVPTGVKGAGQVVTTSFSVPAASLGFWRGRLKDRGVEAATSGPASAKKRSASTTRPASGSSWSRATGTRARRGREAASLRARRSAACTA
jgi:catechol 2,3-dioxygenase-like lactoylglutathione lyase family enzyme